MNPQRSANDEKGGAIVDMPIESSSDVVEATLMTTPTTIACKDVSYTVKVKSPRKMPFSSSSSTDKSDESIEKKKDHKVILNEVSAIFRPGRFTAIMGASGAGKTSLLNFLAGHVAASSNISGQVLMNGHPVSSRDLKKVSAFVFQDDIILDTMTVREAISMSALLRLPKTVTKDEREQRISALIETLQLQKCQHTRIGNQWVKGVSGGERKRTAIAMDLVVNPAVLMLDEPTSGLDTFTAFNVVSCLSDLARKFERTIVATLHQPSSEIFHLIDDLLLLSDGQVVYYGPAEGVVDYFSLLGFPCPMYTNPADHVFMQVMNETATTEELAKGNSEMASRDRLFKVRTAWKSSQEYSKLKADIIGQSRPSSPMEFEQIITESEARRAPFSTQFSFLAQRVFKNLLRNFMIVGMRLIQMVMIGFTIGFIFYDIRSKTAMSQSNNRLGALNFYSINLFLGSSMGVVTTFVNEKNVFQREYTAGYYGSLAYFLSKSLVELPHNLLMPLVALTASYFLIGFRSGAIYFFKAYLALMSLSLAGVGVGTLAGALFKDINKGMVILSMLMLPFIVFSGMIVNNQTLSWPLKWVPYICPTWYTFTALARNELEGYTFPNCKAPPKLPPQFVTDDFPELIDCTGDSTLKINDLNMGPQYTTSIVVLLSIYLSMMIIAYLALSQMARSRSH